MARTIRPLETADAERVLSAWRAAYPGRTRTRATWDWLFERNPAGRRGFLALEGERVIAQYAALPARVWVAGADRVFAQIVDMFVDPQMRRGLRSTGLLVETARQFFRAYGGPERDWVHYGWPIRAGLRLGERFLSYESVRSECVLVRELEPRRPAGSDHGSGSELVPIERFDEQARWLWDRCAGDFGASAIRDAEYLNWRYVDTPEPWYERWGVRDADGILRGLAVLREMDWFVPDLYVVADWLVPPAEPEVAEELLRGIEARAAGRGARAVVASFPEWSPWFARFQERGFRVVPTDYVMIARNFEAHMDMRWLQRHWWYQLGDLDLV